MSKIFKVYNLNFINVDDFQPFTIADYTFAPIPEKQPQKRNFYPSHYFLKCNRNMVINAYVTIPVEQQDSVLRKGGKSSSYRKIKFIEDILMLISIFIGRNVVLQSHKKRLEFPLCAAKHCEMIAQNSDELEHYLRSAIAQIELPEWQEKHDKGFHIRQFYSASNIFTGEARFLADVTIWEFLYYCEHKRSMPYEKLEWISLNTKINYLTKKYLLDGRASSIPEERLRIFADLRNQLSHSGKLPIQKPKSPFTHLNIQGCFAYIRLFKHLTQALVLRTLGITGVVEKLSVFDVRSHFDELVDSGEVKFYESLTDE